MASSRCQRLSLKKRIFFHTHSQKEKEESRIRSAISLISFLYCGRSNDPRLLFSFCACGQESIGIKEKEKMKPWCACAFTFGEFHSLSSLCLLIDSWKGNGNGSIIPCPKIQETASAHPKRLWKKNSCRGLCLLIILWTGKEWSDHFQVSFLIFPIFPFSKRKSKCLQALFERS